MALVFNGDLEEAEHISDLFGIEEDIGYNGGWVLMQRSDENGWGRPLLWYTYEDAEKVIKERAESGGIYGDARVIQFNLFTQYAPPEHCDCCGEWGHVESVCTPAGSSVEHNCVGASS